MRGIVESNVFGIAGGVCDNTLLLGHLGDCTRSQVKAVATYGAAGFGTVGIV